MFTPGTYTKRRTLLKEKLNGGILLFIGNELSAMNYRDNIYPFRQDSTFLYYFGLNRPSLSALIDIEGDAEIIFGDDATLDSIIWTGKLPLLREEAAGAGIKDTRPLSDLGKYLRKAIDKARPIHFLPPYREEHTRAVSRLTGLACEKVPEACSVEFIRAIVSQREVKSEEEIAEIAQAVDVSVDMHSRAILFAKAGMKEAQLAAEVHKTALAAGCELAFPIIATVNGQILHNYYYGNTLRKGDIFLLDAGAQAPSGYAGDLSSSFPVSGKFTERQKEIYLVSQEAHRAAVQALKPGTRFREVHLAACRAIIEGLKQLGIMKGDTEEALAAGAHALFFPCGVGHMMGLDVHDMENLGEDFVGYGSETRSSQFGLRSLRLAKELKPGFVHTIEPGIYFIPDLIDSWQSQNLHTEFLNYDRINTYRDFGGIRNEENFVITADGHRKLGKDFPKGIEDIEGMRL
ncbi:MAG: aminopeptidase P family protein [Bacteroidales bacterium]|nr:aminopeptidase P family protein [Bacteroidales bacterium]